jgi:cellobiose-specific phosphotransferase system component IIC
MFLISFLLNVIFSIYSVAGYDRLFYSQTLVVEFGQITNAGYLLKLRESIISSLIISVAMVLFWFIAVHERNDSVKNA